MCGRHVRDRVWDVREHFHINIERQVEKGTLAPILRHDEYVEKAHDQNMDKAADSENVDNIHEQNSDRDGSSVQMIYLERKRRSKNDFEID